MVELLFYALEFEFLRFSLVGLLGMGVYYTVYVPCVRFKENWYVLWASLAFLGSIATSFPLHKYWTFENADPNMIEFHLMLFVPQRFAFQVANTFLLRLFVNGFRPFACEHYIGHVQMRPILAQVSSHIALAIPSFLVTKMIFLPT